TITISAAKPNYISGIALKKFKDSGETDGKGFATAGLIIGIISMVLYFGMILCFGCLGGLAAMGSTY
ncbi:MAG: hypothetical protein ACI4JS_03560, partial [Oscillospiraceae bacterium]